MKWIQAAVTTLVLAVVADGAFAQCPMCRTALGSPEGQQLAAAFRGGILLLVAVPFAAVATIALLVARQLRAAGSIGAVDSAASEKEGGPRSDSLVTRSVGT